MKLFTSMSHPPWVQLYEDAGFKIVSLDARDVLTGLKVGVIEAVPAPASAALANQWFGLASHMMDMRLAPNVGAMVIAKATWDRIDPTLRPALLAIARQTGAACASRFRAHEAAAIDTMLKSGLQIQTLTPQAEQEWRQVADGLYPKIRGTLLPADLFDDVTRLVSEYREQQKPEPVKQQAVVQPAAAFSRFESLFPAGTAVVVETVDGRTIKGRLSSLSESGLVFDKAGAPTVPLESVRTISRRVGRRPWLKGLMIGAAAGAGLGLLILAQDQQDGSACASGMPSCGTDDGWSAGSTAGVITAIGAGVAVGEEGHASARGVRLAVHVPSSHQERRGLHGDHRRTALCRPPLV